MARLAALGGLALLEDDGPRTGSAARGRNLALLALLARGGEAGLAREKIAAFLWPESDEERARHSLNQAVYTLRRELGSGVFVAGPTSLALNREVIDSDVAEFERAQASGDHARAVACYGGRFLDGFHLSGAPGFEEWMDGERATLHRAYVGALEELATEAADRGDVTAAAGLWRRIADAEPLSSRVALALMSALHEAGDRTGALGVARAHAARVETELGAPPDPSVTAYEEELRRPLAPRETALPVEKAPAPSDTSVPERRPAAPPPVATGTPPETRRSRVWVGMMVGAAAVLAIGAIISESKPSIRDGPPRVTVLPFENETADTALSALGHLAADWITEGLVETELVQVTDPARPASAESVVSGRIYRVGDSIQVRARVTRDGAVVRALDAVAVSPAEPSAALGPLRQHVLGALGTLYDDRLSTWTRSDAHPPTYAAYRAFAAGVELMAMPRDLAGAERSFRRASQLDPTYVLPRLWLTWASSMEENYARVDSLSRTLQDERLRMSPLERAWLDRIEALLEGDREASFQAARRMAEAAPGSGWLLALANAALDTNRPSVAVSALRSTGVETLGSEAGYGWFLLTAAYHRLGQYTRELEATNEAIRAHGLRWGFLGPGIPALAALGRMDELEHRLEELRHGSALENDLPAGPTSLLTAVTELRAHGFAVEAEAIADRWLSVGPTVALGAPGGVPASMLGVELLYESGRWKGASELLEALPEAARTGLSPEAMRGLLAARLGDTATAVRVFHRLGKVHGRWLFGEPALWRARIEAVLGRDDRAMSLLREAFAGGQGARAWHTLHASRDFDGLRDREDFQKLSRPRS